MYARLVLFNLGPDGLSKARGLADDLAPAISARTGYVSATFFGDAMAGEYGFIVLWESQEDAEAAADVIGPRLMEGLRGSVKEPPTIRLFEVIKQ